VSRDLFFVFEQEMEKGTTGKGTYYVVKGLSKGSNFNG